ncbi:MAG: class A beta-lactamase-related serine hydrolase [Clostridiales bacterium]|nr:class A beta-lactamase-related serine hydrolase [Clostridiales bacterium]
MSASPASKKKSRKDPLSKGRITAFAVAFAAAFLLPVLLSGLVFVTGWDLTDLLNAGGAADRQPLRAKALVLCSDEMARLEVQEQKEYEEERLVKEAEEAAKDPCQEILKDLPAAADGVVYLGGYKPSKAVQDALDACIAGTKNRGRSAGFVMLDLSTGMGAAYNTAEEFYGASSLKIHRVLAVAETDPKLLKNNRWRVRAILVESDNATYEWLYDTYGNKVLDQYASVAGAKLRFSRGRQYAYYDVAAFARLWKHAYDLMQENPACEEAGALAEKPYYSSIHRLLKGQYTTRSKAGWIYEGGIRAAADGGIVYDRESPYLIVIMSDYASDLTLLDPYVKALEEAHQDIKRAGQPK